MAITCKSFPVERQTIKDNTAKETKSSRSCNSESIVTVVITKRTCKGKSYKQDSAWAWLMAICGLVCNIIVNGNVFCFGILNPVLLEEFQQGKARTAWIGSLCMAGTSFYGAVVGKLCDRLGTRVVAMIGALTFVSGLLASSQVPSMWMLYLTYSGFLGFGTCCVHVASCLAVSRSFYRRRAFAMGMLVAGRATGILILSPVWQLLLVNLGWRNSFLAMAGLSAPICILVCIFETDLVEELQVKKPIKQYRQNIHPQPFSIWKYPPFVVYTVSSVLLFFGVYIPNVHMASYCKDLNIDGNDAAQLYVGLGVASMVSTLLVGKICDVKMFSAERIYQSAGLMMTIANLLCPLATNYAGLMVYFLVLGGTEGSVLMSMYHLILNCVPKEARSKSMGFWLFALSFTLAAGPPFAGFLADELGSYVPTFYLAGGIIFISFIVVFLLRFFKKEEATLIDEDNSDTDLIVEKLTVL